MRLFLILAASHFISDYLGYSQSLSELKRSKWIFGQWMAVLIHSVLHMGVTMVAMNFFNYDWFSIMEVGKLVLAFHFAIDFIRCMIETRVLKFGGHHIGWRYAIKEIWNHRWSKHVISGVADQSLHLLSLIVVVKVVL